MKTLVVSLLVLTAMMLSSCGKSSSSNSGHADSTMAQSGDYYTCTMHPQVHLDKPGVCPICGMELVKASNSRKMESVGTITMVPLNDRDQLLANVSTVKVGYEDVEHSVRAFGSLEIAEPNKTVISARFNGRIEKLHVDAVGTKVKQGDALFEIYSPDIIQAENEYLQAVKTGSSEQQSVVSDPKSKLLLLGLTQQQIHELESANTVPLVTTYYSPANGMVIDKKIVTGVYVSEGSTLYEISDISMLWNIAEVYESDAGYIRVGEKAKLSIASYPDEMFTGAVSLIYPVVNPQTRTVKVRVLVNNANGKLKRNMYTETLFTRKKEKALIVPVGAVLVTGKRNLVYVKAEHENHFEAREVGIGSRFNGKYEITWGLSEGEVVVSEGGYLIDSESQLKSGTGAAHQHGSSTTPETKSEEMPTEHKH